MHDIIEKKLDELREFDRQTPLYFEIDEAIEILKNYDEDELFLILQFDEEIKSVLEPFFIACYTARIIYENIDFIKLRKTISDIVEPQDYIRELKLLDLLRFIAIYYDFIQIKTNTTLYHENILGLKKILNELLSEMEQLKDDATDLYMYMILLKNLTMLNNDIVNNKIALKKELRRILKNKKNIDFTFFSYLISEYCLSVFNQESFFDSLNYINNIYEFISYYNLNFDSVPKIIEKYDEFIKLLDENKRIQKSLSGGKNGQSLI